MAERGKAVNAAVTELNDTMVEIQVELEQEEEVHKLHYCKLVKQYNLHQVIHLEIA